ncbi:unnamed protein product [Thelazia callipaeda]|uniref:Uncharacterized protein n=1 Tax=Thelazia callipaeda TaxID=103827 RepID=A0A0N5DBB8_THECL|nr:unnamed protein product [Thelazia callipaeda]
MVPIIPLATIIFVMRPTIGEEPYVKFICLQYFYNCSDSMLMKKIETLNDESFCPGIGLSLACLAKKSTVGKLFCRWQIIVNGIPSKCLSFQQGVKPPTTYFERRQALESCQEEHKDYFDYSTQLKRRSDDLIVRFMKVCSRPVAISIGLEGCPYQVVEYCYAANNKRPFCTKSECQNVDWEKVFGKKDEFKPMEVRTTEEPTERVRKKNTTVKNVKKKVKFNVSLHKEQLVGESDEIDVAALNQINLLHFLITLVIIIVFTTGTLTY